MTFQKVEHDDAGTHSSADWLRCRTGSAWAAAQAHKHESTADLPQATATTCTTTSGQQFFAQQ
jgi:hypothetical protein